MAVDRIKRLNATLVIPPMPKQAAIAAALGRKDLVLLMATIDRENAEWLKTLQTQIEQAISAARDSAP